ncbi:Hypothetical protein PHPALM_1478 [Phytophthora palmivora]|uniref:Uncharacterized protein n=1 Tax=Phytophthora palmivora TaxID=4796 RepID=A0A2P4YS72_9STRA|nr:Hypothetical protein PHPALM_1478 [Phytophthora palmivora]
MMRRRGRRPAQYEDEEDERVVYYDLDDGSHDRNLLLTSDAVSAPAQSRAAAVSGDVGGNQIFTRQQQQPLFNLDDSECEEEENPFATLLQQQQVQNAAKSAVEVEEAATSGNVRGHHISSVSMARGTGVLPKEQAPRQPVGRGGSHRSILKDSQHNAATSRISANNKKKLGFEVAGSRPDRWSTKKPSVIDAKNRRKSLGAIQKRRSQLEASAAKRRKSMPASLSRSQETQNNSILDNNVGSGPVAPKKRLLLDVLQRATTLSQQLNTINEGTSIEQVYGNPTETDAILDTEHQMRAEPFTPQFFSPTKPTSTSTNAKSKSKGDAIVSKIRGNVGDIIRKAIRRRNRDLTLLRSHGQHLLPQQSNHSLPQGMSGAVESIQDRASLLICLKQRCNVTSHSVSYECQIHKVAGKLEKTTASVLKDKHTMVLEVHFQLRTAEYLKLSSGKLLKIYEPLHFVEEKVAAGSSSKLKWFLLSTQLTEVVQDSHHCTDSAHE